MFTFVFADKNVYGNGYNSYIFYTWNIEECDRKIGSIGLRLFYGQEERLNFDIDTLGLDSYHRELPSVSAAAYLYRHEFKHISEDIITDIINDFIQLANNKLLDVDEPYGNVYTVEVTFDDFDSPTHSYRLDLSEYL